MEDMLALVIIWEFGLHQTTTTRLTSRHLGDGGSSPRMPVASGRFIGICYTKSVIVPTIDWHPAFGG